MIELETSRLKFRQWQLSDFDPIAKYFSNEELARYVGGVQSAEAAWRLLATYVGHYELKGYSYLAVEETASNELIGTVGLWNSEPWPELELGYWLLPQMQGKGYGVEAGEAVVKFAFETLQVKTFVSYIDKNNKPSIKLAKRIGAVYDGDIELLSFGTHGVYRYTK